jgi:hypothetical protein
MSDETKAKTDIEEPRGFWKDLLQKLKSKLQKWEGNLGIGEIVGDPYSEGQENKKLDYCLGNCLMIFELIILLICWWITFPLSGLEMIWMISFQVVWFIVIISMGIIDVKIIIRYFKDNRIYLALGMMLMLPLLLEGLFIFVTWFSPVSHRGFVRILGIIGILLIGIGESFFIVRFFNQERRDVASGMIPTIIMVPVVLTSIFFIFIVIAFASGTLTGVFN